MVTSLVERALGTRTASAVPFRSTPNPSFFRIPDTSSSDTSSPSSWRTRSGRTSSVRAGSRHTPMSVAAQGSVASGSMSLSKRTK